MNNTIDPKIGSSEKYPKWRRWNISKIAAIEAEGTRPLKCKYCRSTFRYTQGLDMHIKEVHVDPIEWSELQTLPAKQNNQMINTNQMTNTATERVGISQYKPARKESVIIPNPNFFC